MKYVHTEYSQKAKGHYSAGVISGDLCFISGQLSKDPVTGEIPKGGIIPETERALKNVDLVLKSAGLVRTDLVSCRVYIPDVALWEDVNSVYEKFFGEHKPARVVVPSGKLHDGCLVEIEAIAEINKK